MLLLNNERKLFAGYFFLIAHFAVVHISLTYLLVHLVINLLSCLLTFSDVASVVIVRYPEYSVEVFFVNTQEMAVVLSQHNRCRSARERSQNKLYRGN